MTPKSRFEQKVQVTPGCWKWTGSKNKYGYGRFWLAGAIVGAHRVSYELYVGQIPEGMCVCHRCDNPECVNPDHLFVGTHQENMRDMAAKGRNFTPALKGQANGMAKLTNEQIAAIRQDGRKVTAIARAYGVAHQHVSKIKLGQRGIVGVAAGR